MWKRTVEGQWGKHWETSKTVEGRWGKQLRKHTLVCFLQEPVSNRHRWFKTQAHEKRGRRRETGFCSGDSCIHTPRYWHPPAIGVDLRVRQAFQRRRICAIGHLETLNTWSVIVLWSREERKQRCRDGRRNCSTIGTFSCALWSCCATLELQGSLLDRIPSFQTRWVCCWMLIIASFSNSSYRPSLLFHSSFWSRLWSMKLRRMRQTRFVLFSCTGAEVLAQEPYVAVLDGNSQHKRCDRCFSLSSNLKRCSACKSVFYCCILCQVLSAISFLTQEAPHWFIHCGKLSFFHLEALSPKPWDVVGVVCLFEQKKEWLLHKYECQATVKLFKEKQRTLTSSLRLMLRLWIKRRLQAEGVSECIYIATSSSSLILLYLVFWAWMVLTILSCFFGALSFSSVGCIYLESFLFWEQSWQTLK